MSSLITPTPLRYTDSAEHAEEGEAQITQELTQTLLRISETTLADSGHAMRSVHAKGHGLLYGELQVFDVLPAVLGQGLFAAPHKLPVVMRLSTIPGDILDDAVSTPRGLGVKIVGVEGQRLPGSENDRTQDFVLVNGPAFGAPDAKHFLRSLKLLAGTTDKVPGLKKALSAVLRGTEKVLEAFGGESGTLKALGGHAETHILGETFYTQVPILYGDFMAKLCIAPVSPELAALKDAPLDLSDKPNGLRDAVVDFFNHHAAEWEVRVQLCTDLNTMPIEDASVPWPEDESPYIAVARITVPMQQAWSDIASGEAEDALAFSPWHGLAAHRPLGSIMRVRKAAYEASAHFRAENNHLSTAEPRGLGCPVHHG